MLRGRKRRTVHTDLAPAPRAYVCEALESRLLLTTFTINGTAGSDTIVLSTGIRFVPPGTTVDEVRWSLGGGATQQIAVTPGSDSILLDTGTGSDTVTVTSTFSNVPTTIEGGDGGGILTIGNSGNGMQSIAGDITIITQSNVMLDDTADVAPRNVNVDESLAAAFGAVFSFNVTALAPGALDDRIMSFGTQSASNLAIQAGPASDTFNVSLNLAQTNVVTAVSFATMDINTGMGADTVNVTGDLAPLTLTDQAGAGEINVFYGTGDILGNITVNGGGAADLTVAGASPADQFSLSSIGVTHGAATLSYSDIRSVLLELGTFNVTNDLGGVNVTAQGVGTFVNLQGIEHLASLTIGTGARVNVAPAGMPWGNTLFCSDLSIAGTGKLDLTNNQLFLSYAADPIATIRSYLRSGFSAGAWNGPGIVSSSADAHHGLGLADAADGTLPANTLAANEILVRWTRFGDANLDGVVNFSDVLILIQHYGRSNQNWDQGDFNYDSTVNFTDVLSLIQNYGSGLASTAQPPVSAAAVAPLLTEFVSHPRRRRVVAH